MKKSLILFALTGLFACQKESLTPVFNVEEFTPGIEDFIMLNSSGITDGLVRITPAIGSKSGAFYFKEKVAILSGFEAEFTLSMTQKGGANDDKGENGADGMTFIIHNTDPNSLGSPGSGMGYQGVKNSLVLEFDQFSNNSSQWGFLGDLNSNHISWHTRGQDPNSVNENASLGSNTNIPDLSDGNIHHVKIVYQDSGKLEVFIDRVTTPNLSLEIDISQTINLPDGQAYIGFTAATGSAWQNHDVHSWNFKVKKK